MHQLPDTNASTNAYLGFVWDQLGINVPQILQKVKVGINREENPGESRESPI